MNLPKRPRHISWNYFRTDKQARMLINAVHLQRRRVPWTPSRCFLTLSKWACHVIQLIWCNFACIRSKSLKKFFTKVCYGQTKIQPPKNPSTFMLWLFGVFTPTTIWEDLGPESAPRARELCALKLVPLMFPVTDFQHPVVTPATLLADHWASQLANLGENIQDLVSEGSMFFSCILH